MLDRTPSRELQEHLWVFPMDYPIKLIGLAGEDGEGCTPSLEDGNRVGVHTRRITRSRSRATRPFWSHAGPVNLETGLVVGRRPLSHQNSQTEAVSGRHYVV